MPPKARAIADLLDLHEGALAASFQAIYTLRLTDAIRDRSFEEIWDLIVWLPQGCPFWASSVAEGDFEKAKRLVGWTVEADYNLAQLNLQAEQNWMFASAHSEKRVPKPDWMPGPFDAVRKKERRGPTNADIFARNLLDQLG